MKQRVQLANVVSARIQFASRRDLCTAGPDNAKCILEHDHSGPHEALVQWSAHVHAPRTTAELLASFTNAGIHVHRLHKGMENGVKLPYWKLHFRGRSRLCGTDACLLVGIK